MFPACFCCFVSQQCLISMGVTDASFVVKDKEASDVGRFLNRILGLSVERQNLVSVKHQPVTFYNWHILASLQLATAASFVEQFITLSASTRISALLNEELNVRGTNARGIFVFMIPDEFRFLPTKARTFQNLPQACYLLLATCLPNLSYPPIIWQVILMDINI